MLKLLYDDMEELAACRGLLWVLYAYEKTFKIVLTIAKIVLCYMLFPVSFKVPFSLLYSAVISAWMDIIELFDTPRPASLVWPIHLNVK